jgi:hypothetical protein
MLSVGMVLDGGKAHGGRVLAGSICGGRARLA